MYQLAKSLVFCSNLFGLGFCTKHLAYHWNCEGCDFEPPTSIDMDAEICRAPLLMGLQKLQPLIMTCLFIFKFKFDILNLVIKFKEEVSKPQELIYCKQLTVNEWAAQLS